MHRLLLLFTCLLFTGITAATPKPANDVQEAISLARQADDLLRSGDAVRAGELIRQSIDKYPVTEAFDYARSLAKLSDLVGANLVMDRLIDRVRNFPANTLQVKGTMPGMSTMMEIEKSRAHWIFAFRSYEVNRAFGNRDQILKSLRALEEPVIIEKKSPGKFGFDYESHMQKVFRYMHAVYRGNLDEARQLLDKIPVGLLMSPEVRQMTKLALEVVANRYDNALAIARDLQKKKGYEAAMDFNFFWIYAMKGDQRALEYYRKLPAALLEQNRTYYLLALLDLAKEDYASALKNLKMSTSLRETNIMMSDQLTENWDLYKAYGDAYAGLKDYTKARRNYEISLLYYPGYKPAQEAIASLSRLQVAELSSDKTPPVIRITAPEASRGLKVTSAGSTLTVRGTATDPGGITSVTLNGQPAFIPDGSNFWGSVSLKPGSNEITVAATDKAGNTATHRFTVDSEEKPEPPAPAILAVEKRTGRNYCLLIAAQNYADSAIPSLENPVADAIKLKLVLKDQYAFDDRDIFTLFNPQTADIRRKLMELSNLIQPEDNLVIFYAGHGIWIEQEKKGYWLMTDAKYSDRTTWLPNKDVLDLIARLPSRHTLLITDACFSGSVFRTRGLGSGAPAAIRELDEKISRVAITSGNDTEVPDESVFMKHLVRALRENKDQYLTAQKMFVTQIIEAVMTETRTEPRYGTLESAGHIGGDFIFTKR